MGRVIAVCVSDVKGIQKTERDSVELVPDWGIKDDAHAGKWHRQVSLLPVEAIEDFKARGAVVDNGAFGENLIVEGFDLKALPVGTRLEIGPCLVEITQIGKECHTHCAIYHSMGECIMPHEGVFAKVLRGGIVVPGTPVELIG